MLKPGPASCADEDPCTVDTCLADAPPQGGTSIGSCSNEPVPLCPTPAVTVTSPADFVTDLTGTDGSDPDASCSFGLLFATNVSDEVLAGVFQVCWYDDGVQMGCE